MTHITFDTMKFVKTLEAGNFTRQQAEAISSAMQNTYDIANLATKDDLLRLEGRANIRLEKLNTDLVHMEEKFNAKLTHVEEKLNANLTHVEEKLNNKIDKLGLQLIIKLGAISVISLSALIALMKFML